MVSGGYLSVIYRQRQNFMRERLKPLNIGITEYPLFLILDIDEGLGCNEISKNYFINKSLVSKSVYKLMESGYLEQKKDVKHKQKINLYLTPEGRGVVPEIKRICQEWETEMTKGLDTEEKNFFLKLLRKVHKSSLDYNL